MSEPVSHKSRQSKTEHGTVQSYISGFALSILFTLVPYFLVVNHTVSGNALLATILGFAVLQMIIQVVFFLHLGRGPKPNWNLFFYISTIGVILIVVGGSILIINNLHYNMTPPDQVTKLVNDEGIYQIGGRKTGACQGQHPNHEVKFINNQPVPLHTNAKQCDTLTFISGDNVPRNITFGPNPKNQVYAGESNLSVKKGFNQTITLSQAGTYQFHDQLHGSVQGDFTVASN